MRTHLIPGTDTALFNSTAHEHQNVMSAALDGVISNRFRYDLVDEAKSILTPIIRDEAFSSLTWYIDILILNAVGAMLKDFYAVTRKGAERDESTDHLPTFDSYDQFVKYVESLDAQEETLYGLGFDVEPRIDQIHQLLAFRNELHNVIAGDDELTRCRAVGLVNGVYYTPDVDRIFDMQPKLRPVSARDEHAFAQIAKDEVSRAGLTDADEIAALTEQVIAQQREDQAIENLNSLEWDKRKSEALRQLWVCIGMVDKIEGDDVQTFCDMDADVQYKLLTRFEAAVTSARARAIKSNKLKVLEKGAMRVEVLNVLKRIDDAVKHPRFADLS